MRTIRFFTTLILLLLFGFVATAFAASATVPDDTSLLELLRPVYDAFAHGQYLIAGMAALVFAVAAAKRYAPAKWGIADWVHGEVGGPLMILLGSFGATMMTSLAAGTATWAMFKTAGMIAAGAAGVYTLIKKLFIEPILKPLAAKAPKWMQPMFAMVFWFFDRPSPVAVAEAAGQKAVDEKPATGISSSIKEIE